MGNESDKYFSTNGSLYNWDPEKINLNEEMCGHICHHIRNKLVTVFEECQHEKSLENLKGIVAYLEFLESRIK